jgi:hypothetical protein
MMTTLAAIMGSLPIALGLGAGSEFRQPLGVAVVGGLIVSQAPDIVHNAGDLPLHGGFVGGDAAFLRAPALACRSGHQPWAARTGRVAQDHDCDFRTVASAFLSASSHHRHADAGAVASLLGGAGGKTGVSAATFC